MCTDRILEKLLTDESVLGSSLMPKIQNYIRLIKNKAIADVNQDQRQLTNYLIQFIEKIKRVLYKILNGNDQHEEDSQRKAMLVEAK